MYTEIGIIYVTLKKFTDNNNNENALISSDYYIICVNKTHQGPCARVDFDQVNERCSGTHLFQFGSFDPDGVNFVVSGPAIGDLFGFLHLSAAIYSSSCRLFVRSSFMYRRLSVGVVVVIALRLL